MVVPSHEDRPASAFISFLKPSRVLVLLLILGAVIRTWGITERHFGDTDISTRWADAQYYSTAWDWFRTGAYKHTSLPEFNASNMGVLSFEQDGAKPISRILRAAVIFATGRKSIAWFSALDIVFGVAAMAVLLTWCHGALGPRVAILAGSLWLVAGSQFINIGRSYDYGSIAFFATMAWTSFMQRQQHRLYRTTFFTGLALGLTLASHYALIPFLPVCMVFILLYRNNDGIVGKIKETSLLVAGVVIPYLCIAALYACLSWLTKSEWGMDFFSSLDAAEEDGGPLLQRFNIRHLANDWFMLRFIDGVPFLACVATGVVTVAVLHLKKYRWRWSICDDPLFVLAGVAAFGAILWGFYYYKAPRSRILETSLWPVLAAIGVHYCTSLVSTKLLRGRWLSAIQAVIVIGIMFTQWQHTAPMVRMGAGLREAMARISSEGKTAYGEGEFTVWPCTAKIYNPAIPSDFRWDTLDDFLEINGYDYFYVDYARVLSFIVTYPGAGHHVMLDTYNRLVGNVEPVWRFEYGAPLHARLEHSRIDWFRQWYTQDAWRKHHPAPTPFDKLVYNIQYFDVYRAEDVVRVNRESRIAILAQLMIMQQGNPGQFSQVAPRFQKFIQYNRQKPEIMRLAQAQAQQLMGSAQARP